MLPNPDPAWALTRKLSVPDIKRAAAWKQDLVRATAARLINDPAGRSWKS